VLISLIDPADRRRRDVKLPFYAALKPTTHDDLRPREIAGATRKLANSQEKELMADITPDEIFPSCFSPP
jgi:hypothetical protein